MKWNSTNVMIYQWPNNWFEDEGVGLLVTCHKKGVNSHSRVAKMILLLVLGLIAHISTF